jgi:hypothetical protein
VRVRQRSRGDSNPRHHRVRDIVELRDRLKRQTGETKVPPPCARWQVDNECETLAVANEANVAAEQLNPSAQDRERSV